MGFPFQVSDAELKEKKDKKDDEITPEKPGEKPEDEICEEGPSCPVEDKSCPPEPPEEILCMPDFFGCFDRALDSFLPQPPGINININLTVGGKHEDDDFGKHKPQIRSFVDRGCDE